eukprot:TRINITY_DN3425_c0_g1_i6.p1 TRINITY_DN3425_c0_g1~~TRINITY_DN3425_c0_g1_i6.p1  ORF type:complete len:168 (-),score=16.99 TRINITY_DN3425_c0_g1_i6:243-746(-)
MDAAPGCFHDGLYKLYPAPIGSSPATLHISYSYGPTIGALIDHHGRAIRTAGDEQQVLLALEACQCEALFPLSSGHCSKTWATKVLRTARIAPATRERTLSTLRLRLLRRAQRLPSRSRSRSPTLVCTGTDKAWASQDDFQPAIQCVRGALKAGVDGAHQDSQLPVP